MKKLDLFSATEEIPPALKQDLVKTGKDSISRLVPLFDKIDWKLYAGNDLSQILANDLKDVLLEIVKKEPAAIGLISSHLKDSSGRIRRGILDVIYARIEPALDSVKTEWIIDGLESVLKTGKKENRFNCARIISILSRKSSGKPRLLSAILKSDEKDALVKVPLAEALVQLGNEKGKRTLGGTIEHNDARIRMQTAASLGRIKEKWAEKILVSALKREKNEGVIAELVKNLRYHTGQTDREIRQKILGRPF
ncbi:MAG: HEAT repeat domain-containing protein [bacterium]